MTPLGRALQEQSLVWTWPRWAREVWMAVTIGEVFGT